jgi:phage tail sheath protein FI
MASLVSPGVSVTIVDESFYIPASATTVPLFFIATEAKKKQADAVSNATGTFEHSVVRTITSIAQSVSLFGVPKFRVDSASNPLHGDARNEYGLLALNQYLTVGSKAFAVRANVDLSDKPIVQKVALPTVFNASAGSTANGTLQDIVVNQTNAVLETWTITAQSATTFTVAGSVSGSQGTATIGVEYNNGLIAFTAYPGTNPFVAGDVFTIQLTATTVTDPLGSSQAAKRATIVQALQAEINSNQDVRSEYYEYNLIVCPGFYEVIDELQALQDYIKEEAFIVADTPMFMDPDATATWAQTSQRKTGRGTAYYYPAALVSNLDGADVVCAASGIALKQYAYSDSVAELWFAPAGLRRGLVTGVASVGYLEGTAGTATKFVETALNQGQRDNLYEFFKNINPITFFPGRGIIIWGQKTSAPAASALDRVNVMRMMMMIKRDIRKASMAYVFEPNDQITRDSIKSMIDGYLNDIMIRRGLYDFVVLCDNSNNTATRIDRNELWVDISVKPVKAAEFIYIPIRVLNTGASMSN